ncbi:MAG: hypothetical protein NC131_05815 [Roseburia sp.]|nr:hypothetical protein [Roseburia sp.]
MKDKRIIIGLLEKIFAIYNIDPKIKVDDIAVKIEKESKSKNKIKLSTENIKYHILELDLSVRNNGEYNIYSLIKSINALSLIDKNIDDINFIFLNCFRVLKQLMSAYFTNSISEIEINSCLNESIEMSIIAIASGKKIKPTERNGYIPSNFDHVVRGISRMLRALNQWSNRTYEGRKIPYSFLLALDKIKVRNIDTICSFLKDDASALLTDGISSYLEIGEDISYNVAKYYDAEKLDKDMPIVPYRFSSFGNACTNGKLGIILTVQGDVLFVKKKKLIFAKRNNEWHSYDYDAFNRALFKDVPEMHVDAMQKNARIKMIYLTCLDVAFARTGGCLAVCVDDNVKELKKCINHNDIHVPFNKKERVDHNYKRKVLEDVVINKTIFHELLRKARQELLGVDGATVITTDGQFITTGAIMDNNFKNELKDMHGGARTKIAMKLAEFGIAIKISADGYIECYKGIDHNRVF